MERINAYTGEEQRPLVHFTPFQGFMNDPNGLCKYKDTYFMFFQLNPTAITHGNTHWGLAKSTDLIHWTEEEPALCPDEKDGLIFSGSAIVDTKNASGLKQGEDDPILLFYTGTGMLQLPKVPHDSEGKPQYPEGFVRPKAKQCMAYSVDGGKTFQKYEKNPLITEIAQMNRDPNVNYVPEENAYVMALFLSGNEYMLLWSEDLIHWEEGERYVLEKSGECPDLFCLPVDGDPGNKKWVFFGSPENYRIGHFENRRFIPETELIYGCMAEAFQADSRFVETPAYAPQTFNMPEEGRIIQISWLKTSFPGMMFQSAMSLPWELKLVTTEKGLRLQKNLAEEVRLLEKKEAVTACGSSPEELNPAFLRMRSGMFHTHRREAVRLSLKAELSEKARLSFTVRGVNVLYEHESRRLLFPTGEYTLPFVKDTLDIDLAADRGSVELFACGGLFNCVLASVLDVANESVRFFDVTGAKLEVRLQELSL